MKITFEHAALIGFYRMGCNASQIGQILFMGREEVDEYLDFYFGLKLIVSYVQKVNNGVLKASGEDSNIISNLLFKR